MHKFIAFLKKDSQESKKLAAEFSAANIKRIVFGSVVAMIVHLAHIIIYSVVPPGSMIEQEWHRGIVTTHAILLVVMGAASLIALSLRSRKKCGLPEFLLQYTLIALLLAEGVVLTHIDQLVSPNITPYIIFCLVVAVGFIIRPRYSLALYAASYVFFFFAVHSRPFLYDVVLSNRTNGFAIASVGFAVSLLMWRHNTVSTRQRCHIQAQQKKLLDMANLDPLTGVYNRRKFDSIVRQEITQAGPENRESSLIMLDIDYFKQINDTYGHPAGDLVLIQLSQLLKDNIRKSDSLCRLGGEEFIILLPDTSEGKAVAVAEKLRRLIESHTFPAGDKPVRISASFGIASLDYSEDPKLINQYSKVDHALYIAKQNGRNQVIAV